MPVLVVLLTLSLMLGQQSATQWFQSRVGLITVFSEALANPQKLGLALVGLGGVAAIVNLSALRIFVSSFQEGWNRYGNVPTGQETTSQVMRRPRVTARLATALPSPLRFLLAKEWLELRRNPRSLLNLVQPLVLVGATLVLFSGAGMGVATLRPLLFYAMLAFLALFLSTQPVGTSLMAIAQEGRNIVVAAHLDDGSAKGKVLGYLPAGGVILDSCLSSCWHLATVANMADGLPGGNRSLGAGWRLDSVDGV